MTLNKIEFGDCRKIIQNWTDDGVKVQAAITSPPYFGLRSYLDDSDDAKVDEIGIEESLQKYIDSLMEMSQSVWNILNEDGIFWVNLGDSYYNHRSGKGQVMPKRNLANSTQDLPQICHRRNTKLSIPEKSLLGVPWKYAFAMQDAGWCLRSECIWVKGSSFLRREGSIMPESVKDRPSRSHEQIFMFTKNPDYYYDYDAVKEEGVYPAGTKAAKGSTRRSTEDGVNSRPDEYATYSGFGNLRTCWRINTKPSKTGHFASYPPELVIPMVKASSKAGDIILDPFMGTGTTAQVAKALGRQYLGCELNKKYEPIIQEKLNTPLILDAPTLNEAPVPTDIFFQ